MTAPCPNCGTMLEFRPYYDGSLPYEPDGTLHDLPRCIGVLHAQLTAERAKVEEAIGIAVALATYHTDTMPYELALAALEKLRNG